LRRTRTRRHRQRHDDPRTAFGAVGQDETAVEGLGPFDIGWVIAGHCTGWRALHALANAYGERVSQSAVGTRYVFDASVPGSQRVTPPAPSFEAKPGW